MTGKYNNNRTLLIAGFLVLLFFFCAPASAQDRRLKEVRVRHKKEYKNQLKDERLNSFAPGMKILNIDAPLLEQYALQNLGQLLAQQVPVFIRSYGMNSLATLNFRGSSAAQSQVLWNGVPLNNAAVGMADVSLLSVHSFDQINIAYGGSSALLGSGNVGAALLLDNRFAAKDSSVKWKTNIAGEAASFGQYKLALQEQYSFKRIFVSAKLSGQTAKNDFPYNNQTGITQQMQNAQLRSLNGMLNLGYRFNEKVQMNLSAWYQHFDREIPPALFEAYSVKSQQDEALRLLLEFKKTSSGQAKWYTKTALMRDGMQYTDSAARLDTKNYTFQLYEELGWKKMFGRQHELLLFIPVNISWIRPQNDTVTRFQNRIALAAAYKYQAFRNKLSIAANARLEQINDQSIFLPGMNASYDLCYFMRLRVNVQRSYRAPTMNEWYYQPGGNPLLKPEQGWSQDAGYELKIPVAGQGLFTHDLSIFNRSINDWILWFGGSIWTPHNIARVHSRGIESTNAFLWKKERWTFQLGLNTSFVLATTQRSYLPGDGSIGKQIPYSPRYNGQVNAGLGYSDLYITYNHTYTGYRFMTTDESQFLLPYETGNIYAVYKKVFRKKEYRFSLQCNNIWDRKYQVVNARPMPGRNFGAGFSAGF